MDGMMDTSQRDNPDSRNAKNFRLWQSQATSLQVPGHHEAFGNLGTDLLTAAIREYFSNDSYSSKVTDSNHPGLSILGDPGTLRQAAHSQGMTRQ